MEEKTEGIYIPENIVHNKNISMFAKVLYGVIASICKRDGFCNKTNEHLAKLLGVQKCIISRWINKFSDKEFSKEVFSGKKPLKVIYKGKHKYIRFIFLSTTDKDTIKRIVHTYHTIVPPCKILLKSMEHTTNALNTTTSFDNDEFDFDNNDMDK